MARHMMHKNMIHNDKAQIRNGVSYYAGAAYTFVGFYWYAYFCNRYRKTG